MPYPEIRRSGVEVEHESLAWSANRDGAEILRIVLLVIRRHLSALSRAGILLRKNAMGVSLASKLVELPVSASLCGLLHLEVWASQGRLEAPFLEEVDIRLGTRSLVLLVGYETDLLQSLKSRHGECALMINI